MEWTPPLTRDLAAGGVPLFWARVMVMGPWRLRARSRSPEILPEATSVSESNRVARFSVVTGTKLTTQLRPSEKAFITTAESGVRCRWSPTAARGHVLRDRAAGKRPMNHGFCQGVFQPAELLGPGETPTGLVQAWTNKCPLDRTRDRMNQG